MKKIAIISEHASPLAALGGIDSGGQNVYVNQVARHLGQNGFDVDIFTRRDNMQMLEIIKLWPNVRLILVPAGPAVKIPKEDLLGYMDSFSDYVIEQAKKRRYDLIHANFFMSGLVALKAKKILDIPFIMTFHALGRVRRMYQAGQDGFSDERFSIEDEIVQAADAIIAECPQEESDLVQLYNACPDKISLIPCGFDPQELRPESKALAKKKLSFKPSEKVVLQLGRIVPRKGVDNVIRSIAVLKKRYNQEVKLLIVGGNSKKPCPVLTPEIARLTKIAETEEVSENAIFKGSAGRAELVDYYNAADIFISTPWYEPFGITPLEAAACGTPVIGSNVGGIKYSVADARTGFLVNPNDHEQLAQRINLLYKNEFIMEKMGKQSILRVNNMFTWQKVALQIARLSERIINNGYKLGSNLYTPSLTA